MFRFASRGSAAHNREISWTRLQTVPGCTARHALVTGASSGIGLATVRELSHRGFHVFGTVRQHADAAAIRHGAPGEITPLIMDVADPDQIREAVRSVERHVGPTGLDVLVNNAGVGVAYPLEAIPLETLRWQFAINVDAQVAVTQALLPLIRRASGRIVMIGSIGDRLTMPFAGPLAAAKHAVRALADAFRLELAASDIRGRADRTRDDPHRCRRQTRTRRGGDLEQPRCAATVAVCRGVHGRDHQGRGYRTRRQPAERRREMRCPGGRNAQATGALSRRQACPTARRCGTCCRRRGP